jgi:ubiquinone/menaquinone biosynthesis C-methylase UbiE
MLVLDPASRDAARQDISGRSGALEYTAPMNSDRDWERWGRIDPLWSVATWPGKQRGGAAPWTDEEFYATGAADWRMYLGHWERHGLDRASCVEIGCGAGRLTKHLASAFQRTWALDVSEGMLAYARERISEPSVTFERVSGSVIPLPDASASAVFSTFVFQHFDSLAAATAYFREIARVLRPGGSMLIQLPVHQWPLDLRLFEFVHRAWTAAESARVWLQRALAPLGAKPAMRGLSYPLSYLFETLGAAGLEEIEVSSLPGAHHLVFARKL